MEKRLFNPLRSFKLSFVVAVESRESLVSWVLPLDAQLFVWTFIFGVVFVFPLFRAMRTVLSFTPRFLSVRSGRC